MSTPSYRFVVGGRVQGVGFRQATQSTATQLGLRGWVRNRTDGRVEGLVMRSTEPGALERFRQFLRSGPRLAEVNELQWVACDEEFVSERFEVRG